MRTDVNDPCLACEIVAGRVRPVGGIVARQGRLVVHGFADPSPLRGWMVVTSERHLRGWADLDEAELAQLGPLVARVMRAQKEVLGAEHAYAFAIGDVLRHFHLHVVPRFPDTPAHLRGRGAFDAAVGERLPAEGLEEAAQALSRALASD
jgi:diadenosine tetraphosphate (Ap4A) HIT family hydrolase